jgi:hypothetical protein
LASPELLNDVGNNDRNNARTVVSARELNIVSRKTKRAGKNKRWSSRVTKESNALDLEPKVFRSQSPRKIALSLKRSAERSTRRKAKPYQSAMSMLNFYINRTGKNLPKDRKRTLERAKDELRDVFGRE